MSVEPRLPRVGRWLLAMRRLGDRRSEVESDLLQLFREREAARGQGYARRRYLLDALSVWLHRRPLVNAETRPSISHARPLDGVARDLMFGARVYRRQWGVVAVTVVSLGLAIGVCTAVFSGVYAFFLRPLGVASPDRAVHLWRTHENGASAYWSYAEYLATRQQTRSVVLEPIIEAHVATGDNSPGSTDISWARIGLITGTFFATFGGEAKAGRLIGPHDDILGAPLVGVVNYYFWNRWLGGDPGIVGRTVRLGKVPVRIVGVASRWFTGPEWQDRDFWLPLMASSTAWPKYGPLHASSTAQVKVVGQIAEDRTLDQARAEVSAVLRSVAAAGAPTTLKPATGVDTAAPPGPEGGFIPGVALAAIALVLMLASLNVANLLLASGAGRRREMAVRLAMGATRRRLARQLLTESLALAVLAGVAGLVFAMWLTVPLARLVGLGTESEVTAPDTTVYLFLTAASLVAGLVAGFAPARTGARGDLLSPVRGDGTPGIASPPTRRLRAVFVGVQAAASMVLLVLAALLTRALVHTGTVDLGFPADRLLSVTLGTPRNMDAPTLASIRAAVVERLKALPGVEAAALVHAPPLEASAHSKSRFTRGGRPYLVTENMGSADYLAAAGLRMIRGRSFTSEEISATPPAESVRTRPPVAVISETLVRDYWGESDPIGTSLDRVDPKLAGTYVIGVVADAITYRLEEPRTPAIYYPLSPMAGYATIVVRVQEKPEAFVEHVRSAGKAVDSRVSASAWLATRSIDRAQRQAAMLATLGGLGGGLALALAVLGVFSVTAFVVGQRTREIGLRMAVGASASRIVRLLLREGLRPVVVGLIVGLIAAIAGSRVLAAALFGLSPYDPLALTAAVAVLLTAGVAAILIPARRASRVDPAKTLREA
jgi:predicted permease